MKKCFFTSLLFLVFILSADMFPQQEARLLRFPAIYGSQIVFTYAGDLYTVPAAGGTARKLTNNAGFEMFAHFSPDGKWIAFTGQYDGNTEVYLMPSDGGIPKRLTYTATLDRDDVSDRMGPNNIVMCWKGDDEIVFRSRWIEFDDFKGQLYTVTKDGGMTEQLPLPRGGFCTYSPDLKKLAYNRIFREFRTWKRYRGGQADDIWIYDFDKKTTEDITNNPAQDVFPMWSANKIYFLSDRDSRMNLYSYDLATKETKKYMDFKDFDIKFPSLGDKAIVFENGGYIYRFDLSTEKAEKVPVYINEDFAGGRGGLIDVNKFITEYEISPDGKRALFVARGDLFTVPAENGNIRDITNTSGVHERNAKWSTDGKWIAYISDASGEDEIYIEPQDGSGKPKQLTRNGDTYKYDIVWSPDNKKIMWGDKMQRLQYVDVESEKTTLVTQANAWEIRNYCWSPDSKWIAYEKPEVKVMEKVYLYSLDDNKSVPVTGDWYDSGDPSFSSDGKYLFIVSNRSFNPTFSQTEWNHAYVDMSKIYLITLAKDTQSPFAPKSDEVSIKDTLSDASKKEKDKKENKPEKADKTTKVDLDGIIDRIIELPVAAANYNHIVTVGDKVYYMRNSSKDRQRKIFMYDLGKQKENEIGEFNGYEISTDGKKMIISQNGSFAIIDLPMSKVEIKEKLNLSDLKMNLDRYAEWKQIYNESWRQMRDFFFAPNMHGVNWEKVRENYAPLLNYINNRADLTYIIGEMIGELNIGHTYVGGGDRPMPEKIKLGLLGAKLEKDRSSGYFRIVKILPGQNWTKNVRSPLTEVGVDVKEGDYIIEVDGKPTNAMKNIYKSLVNKADKQVTLKVNSKPEENGSHETVVVPIDDEHELYYYNWVQDNIDKVNKATDGKVGYIHIPDMGVQGLNEFVKHYYPQLRKEALIIDVRGNGGGNVSPQIIERLKREATMITIARNAAPNVDPTGTFVGPKVLLIDEFSASDGDIFPYRFKFHKMGTLIGKRTWGGVVGIRGSLPFVDGGFLNKPEFSRYDLQGKSWIMEGHGVDPDIVVDNDPAQEYEGIDDQLNKAIQVALDDLKTQTFKIPPPPPYPDKSK